MSSTTGGYVPKQVRSAFQRRRHNRSLDQGSDRRQLNTNFGEEFCFAGDVISRKIVPYLYRLN